MSKKTQNYLLAKTGLGEVKKGFHQLPQASHTYGKAPIKDKYGARQVIGNWEQAKKSQKKQGDKDYISMNRQGVKQGFIDSKQITNFRKNNQIKMKIKQGQKVYGVRIPDEQFTYGAPNRPSTPIKNVISNGYAAQQEKLRQQREAVIKMIEKDNNKKSLPKVQATTKSKVQEEQYYSNRKKQIQQNNFKLSKFKGVQSKIKPMFEETKSKHKKENQN